MSTTANLFVEDAPELGERARRYTVDCKWGTTRMFFAPSPTLDLPETTRVSIVLMDHSEDCGKCNLERLWRRHGALKLRDLTGRAWQELGGFALKERRN